MSKWAAIDTAVRLQLALDGKEVSYTKSYGPPPQGANQNDWVVFQQQETRKFLLDVANRLKCDEPSRAFAWRKVDPDKIFGNKLAMMITIIEDVTEDTKQP